MRTTGKYQSIQVLRALAAVMVLIFHSKLITSDHTERDQLLWIPGFSDLGDLGVSLFFVISGFIIANVLSSGNFSVGKYFWRRALRIYPLYWIVMLAGLFMLHRRGWFAADFDSLGLSGMIKSFLIIPQQQKPFWNPGWTLEHEVLFYIIAAIVAPLFGLRILTALLLALALVGMWFNVGWDFHLFASPQLYFAAGIVAYILKEKSWRVALPAASALLVYSYASYYGALTFPAQITEFTFAFGCSFLIVSVVSFEAEGWNPPKPLTALGDASYSLYLWHWMVIPVSSFAYSYIWHSPEFWRWVAVAMSIVVALVSYRLIERPIIAFSQRGFRASTPAVATRHP